MGAVAAMAGLPRRARLVGRVLATLPGGVEIPWHRVVNAKGEVSRAASRNGGDDEQVRRLKAEGIAVDGANRFNLERHRWLE